MIQRFSLPRRFAVAGAAIALLVAAAVGALIVVRWQDQLLDLAQRNNVSLALALSNGLSEHFQDFVRAAHGVPPEMLAQHPDVAQIGAAVARMVKNTNVVKVKIYDLQGITVFSTNPRQLGEDTSANPGYQSALSGMVASNFSYRDQIDSFEGMVVDRDLLASYVPVRDEKGSIYGVFELYSDVTRFKGQLRQTVTIGLGIILLGVATLYLASLYTVVVGNRVLTESHVRNIKLAANVARAQAANQAKSAFLATMSHELRTPLNAVIGFSEMVMNETFGPLGSPRYKEYVGDIHSSGLHLLGIINDVLDLAKAESGVIKLNVTDTDPARVIRDSAQMFRVQAQRDGIHLQVGEMRDLPLIRTDERRLRQVMINVVSNAIKYSRPGDRVDVDAYVEDESESVVIAVRDTGIGIAADDIPLCLEPFGQVETPFTRSREGTGLGLPLSQKFTEVMGGKMELASELGKGTTVTIILPLRAPEFPLAPSEPAPRPAELMPTR
jgi:two-component system, cell cycle sensor histidine kinase PleC